MFDKQKTTFYVIRCNVELRKDQEATMGRKKKKKKCWPLFSADTSCVRNLAPVLKRQSHF